MKRVALYMRVSSDQQVKEGDSIPAQRDALTKYAKEKGYSIVGEYLDDGISGTKYSQRDELQRLLSDVQSGKIDLILITRLDRWFRSVRHYTATQEILDKNNVGWLAIWEPVYDTTTPQGRLIVNQMMSIAQFEAENTGQRIRQVQAYKLSQRK
jgi:DNA invertase Pin-like site-specific DNA recombinase